MSDKRKKWSLKRFLGEVSSGGVTGAAAVGAKAYFIPDPTFQLVSIATGAAVGATAAAIGSGWGYVWDDTIEMEFGSSLLFGSVVGISIAIPFVLIGYLIDDGSRLTENYIFLVIAFSTFIASAFSYMLDDRRARLDRLQRELEKEIDLY